MYMPEPDKPFEKTERLTGQLLQVPKKELEKKLAEYEWEKERKNKQPSSVTKRP